jgi:hypothetical protein
MSTALDEESHLSRCDGYTEFLYQLFVDQDVDTTTLLASTNMGHIESSNYTTENSMHEIYLDAESDPSPTSDNVIKPPPGSSVASIQESNSQRSRKKPKGRPRVDSGNSQTAAEVSRILLAPCSC